MARGRRERELKRSRITVIGEGLTERWYFEHLRNLKGFRYDCKPRFFSQQSYTEMGKLIEQVLQNGGIAVCICDADITRTNENERKRLEKMKSDYKKNERVFICDSMPSIEFWFLLHYLETTKYFHSSEDVITTLNKYLSGYNKQGNYLEKPQWVASLCEDNKLEKACISAESLPQDSQSYSHIYKAIKLFEENKGII